MNRILALALLLPLTASAVPLQVTHQGRLFDALGAPLTGTVDVSVALYDDAATGSQLWTDTFSTTFDQGYYTLTLGSGTALDASVMAGDDVWLELAVDSGPPMPRTQVVSVPFAIRAGSAATADTAAIATEVAAGSVINATEIQVNGTTVIDSTGGLVTAPAPAAHDHDATEVVSGTLDILRIPVGTSNADVAAGDHLHDVSTLTGQLAESQLPGTMDTVITAAVEGASALNLSGDLDVGGSFATDDVTMPGGTLQFTRWNLSTNDAGVIFFSGPTGSWNLDIANAPNPGDLFVNPEGTIGFRRGNAAGPTSSQLYLNIEGGRYSCVLLHEEDDGARAPLWLGTDAGNCCTSIWGNDSTSTALIRNEGYFNNVLPNYSGYDVACF